MEDWKDKMRSDNTDDEGLGHFLWCTGMSSRDIEELIRLIEHEIEPKDQHSCEGGLLTKEKSHRGQRSDRFYVNAQVWDHDRLVCEINDIIQIGAEIYFVTDDHMKLHIKTSQLKKEDK